LDQGSRFGSAHSGGDARNGSFASTRRFPVRAKIDTSCSRAKRLSQRREVVFVSRGKRRVRGQAYTIQVAQDRSSDEQLERKFGVLLVVLLAASIFASALIAVTVTKRSLRPLGQMTRSLERIGPTHLNERVAPAGWPRELQPLALAFDQMLARLEESFTRLSQFSADLAHELRTPIANTPGRSTGHFDA
jgi:Signal transduction histidine kinase